MRSVKITSPEKIEIIEQEIPITPQNHVLLKIKYAGICGSDLQTYLGTQPFASYPRVPGHEFSAEVIEVNGEAKFKKGDFVTGVPYFNCGSCYACNRGIINACYTNETMGVHRDGGFQEYVVMPIRMVHKADSLDPKDLALIEPFSIGYHAVNRAKVSPSDKVLVLGAGAIGLFTMLSALSKGAQVWIADIIDSRLETAKRLGATGTVNLNENDLAEFTSSVVEAGFDVVAEATGLPESFLNAIEVAAHGARIALIGNGKREVSFNQSLIIKKELDILGSRNSREVFPEIIRLIENGLDAKPVITNIVKFDNLVTAFKSLIENPQDNIKILVEF